MTTLGSPILNFDVGGLSTGPYYRGFSQGKSYVGVFSTVLIAVIISYFIATEITDIRKETRTVINSNLYRHQLFEPEPFDLGEMGFKFAIEPLLKSG